MYGLISLLHTNKSNNYDYAIIYDITKISKLNYFDIINCSKLHRNDFNAKLMVIIFEGMDNCLKDSSINLLRNDLSAETHVIKYSSPPNQIKEKENYQKHHFSDMFYLIDSVKSSDRNIILNRSHIGEYVYSQLYRGYHADWIFDLEKEFFNRQKTPVKILLILLYDSNNESLRTREDGKSLSQAENIKLDRERELFIEAFNKSYIPNKLKFNLSELPRDKQDRIDIAVITKEIMKEVNDKAIR